MFIKISQRFLKKHVTIYMKNRLNTVIQWCFQNTEALQPMENSNIDLNNGLSFGCYVVWLANSRWGSSGNHYQQSLLFQYSLVTLMVQKLHTSPLTLIVQPVFFIAHMHNVIYTSRTCSWFSQSIVALTLKSERNNKADRNVPGTTEDVEPGTCHTLNVSISKPLYLWSYPQAKLPNLKEVDVRYTEAWWIRRSRRFIDTGNCWHIIPTQHNQETRTVFIGTSFKDLLIIS